MPGFASIRLFTFLMGLVAGQMTSACCLEQTRSPSSIQTYEGVEAEDQHVFAMPGKQEKLFKADGAIAPLQNAVKPSLSIASSQHAADMPTPYATALHLQTESSGEAAPTGPFTSQVWLV
jgi:hypothetical protein